MTRPSIVWFRRDLRLADHPALLTAAGHGRVIPFVVLDPRLVSRDGPRERRYLASVAALADSTEGALVVRRGDPAEVLTQLTREANPVAVHVSRETTPFGRHRDEDVERRLSQQGVPLVITGSPYAVGPGRIRTGAGSAYKVFTPFSRAWRAHGWPDPAPLPTGLRWHRGCASEPDWQGSGIPDGVGEGAAQQRWSSFLASGLEGYADARDRPDLPGTSGLSVALKLGEIHPRTILAGVRGRDDRDARRFVTELAWREFYADVLWHQPDSAWTDLTGSLRDLAFDDDADAMRAVAAWRAGRTGYPFVDAGMRQLAQTGWMHNRVRMVTASFLVKDLHVRWQIGARHFLDHLLDGDIASNSHGWQWVAGTGTDASPFVRIFNPVTQGERFDPNGDYVRRWIPELGHLPGAQAHSPWNAVGGYDHGYPARLVDHAVQRRVALDRFERARERRTG